MILDKTVKITIGARNLVSVRKYYPNSNVGDNLEIPQKLCLEISTVSKLECLCDKCAKEYNQSASRIKEVPLREFLCGDCMFLHGQENMKKTMRSERKRKDQSKKIKSYCSTDIGSNQRKESGKRHSKYLKSRPDLLEKYTSHLPKMYGEKHPNFNPNKGKFSEYAYIVRIITEKTYKENIDIINQNGYQRTLCGVEGGYQLDHIISVKQGFDEGIPPEIIGGLENLQMLSWKDNRNKWHK